ncbi:MAG: DNA topoisomerase 1 [Firmicutes bacterium ADurb.Bin182]|nr:MAG: DNA topoisomerase 1 [Firmicutes bacterium ADurb.Bin182]
MPEKLVIVESPAKAKTIGKFLGKQYKVIASNGHVRDLPKSQLGVDVNNDFQPKYITLRGRGDVLEKIRKEAKAAKSVYLATDPDREGEAISWHLAQILKLDEKSDCRIVFNEITASAVKNSIKGARPIDMNLVDAQQARRVLDRLVGYKISPVLWAKVRKGLSAGRVQSVATRIICDREQEILDFIPEEYWTIEALLSVKSGAKEFEAKFYGFNGKKTDIKSKAQADEVIEKAKNGIFTVTDIKTAEKTKHAPAPFTTSNLQQEASRKLNFTTKHTMLIAQQLYEGIELQGKETTGLITYIRTDSVRVADEAQQQAREFIQRLYGDRYLPEKPNVYKGRKGAQDAHEAIRPTHIEFTPQSVKASLSANQYKLYRLIYERFIASQMSEAKYESSTIIIDSNGCTFRAVGVRTLFDGFTVVYTEGRDEAQEKEVVLPELVRGERLNLKKLASEQHYTQPPPRYTEASLVKALEEKGIGRPSTYSPTISTIIERGYVQREKKLLIPTELGFIVTQLMKENFSNIVNVKFTADMEEKLDLVEEGEKRWVDILKEFYAPFDETVKAASANIDKVVIADVVSDIPCDKCGTMMVYKTGRFGKFLACPNFPSCRNTKPILEKLDVNCPKCGSALIKQRSKRGKTFYGCGKYPECDFVSWDKPAKEFCPKCNSLMVQKIGPRGSFTICTNKGCGYVLRPAQKEQTDA